MVNMASLVEVETVWSLDDVLKANALLDMRAAVERDSMPKGSK